MLRFHTQTGGVTLTAQQPKNNIVRVALQGFAAVCGGTQSLHTNGYDEALALPTERAAKIALRTQQVIGHESGAADTVDPFAGSYFVEALTDEIEAARAGADRQGRRARRLGQGDRVHHQRDRRERLGLPGALPDRAGHRRRRQQVRRGGDRGRGPAARRPRRPSRRRSSGSRRSRPTATRSQVDERLRGAARRRARAPRTCCPSSRTPCATAPRWARSAARCRTSSASTSRTSDRVRRAEPAARGADRRARRRRRVVPRRGVHVVGRRRAVLRGGGRRRRRVTGVDVMGATRALRAPSASAAARAVRFVQGDLHDAALVAGRAPTTSSGAAGVIYHAPHPLLTLERLRALTGATLLLATETIPEVRRPAARRRSSRPTPARTRRTPRPFDPARATPTGSGA